MISEVETMDKKQFDATLGGSHQLPHDVHVMKLAASRANEIAAMTYSIGSLLFIYLYILTH